MSEAGKRTREREAKELKRETKEARERVRELAKDECREVGKNNRLGEDVPVDLEIPCDSDIKLLKEQKAWSV